MRWAVPIVAFLSVGCRGADAATPTVTIAPPPDPAPGAVEPPAVRAAARVEPPKKNAAPRDPTTRTGVPECDAYLDVIVSCLAGYAPTGSELTEMIEAWRQAAATPTGKAAITTACRSAVDALLTSGMCR